MIHVLITCGGLNLAQTAWINCFYLPHALLKDRFKKHFLEAIQILWTNETIGWISRPLRICFTPSYQEKIVAEVRKKTWFVHIGERLTNAKAVVKYIGRYSLASGIFQNTLKKRINFPVILPDRLYNLFAYNVVPA